LPKELPANKVALPVSAYQSITTINAQHLYEEGLHAISGEVVLPTPCDSLLHDVVVAESFPEQVTINFSVLKNEENCTRVEKSVPFEVEFMASDQAIIKARFMGRMVELNLAEISNEKRLEEES